MIQKAAHNLDQKAIELETYANELETEFNEQEPKRVLINYFEAL